MTATKKEVIKYRDSPLRVLQNVMTPIIPGTIFILNKLGAFPGTNIETTFKEKKRRLNADDITLSQLQMTVHTCKTISELSEKFPTFDLEFLLTSLLNGADGPVARQMKTTSKEGGIKDAAVDRLSEVMIARLITKELNLPEDLSYKLQVSFQLSTLTKAACEMTNTKTSEGGFGSMLQRRKTLYLILKDLIKLKLNPGLRILERKVITGKINKKINFLINSSFQRARERVNLMELSAQLYHRGLLQQNEALKDPNSPAASEARKYAGIVNINNLIGIDIITELNKLTSGSITFPTIEELSHHVENADRKSYITESLNNFQGFLNEALKIVGYGQN